MEFLKRSWRQIRVQAEQLSANARLLIAMCMVCLILIMILFMMYVGKSDYVPITQFAGDRQAEAVTLLSNGGIEVNNESGRLLVRRDQYINALSKLHEADLMVPDTSRAFEELFKNSNIWQSNRQFDQRFHIARQQWLAQVISMMEGVRSANVVFDIPQKTGFGKAGRKPSAAVNVTMDGRGQLDRHMVGGIAGLVSGAVSDLAIQDVVVVDARTGRRHTVPDEYDLGPEERLLAVIQAESRMRDKINELLGYINGVIVQVNVQLNSVGQQTVKKWQREPSESLRSTELIEKERTNRSSSGEPGTRSNTGLAINSSGGTNSSERESTTREEFGDKPITEESMTQMVGQSVEKIHVSVKVPRSHLKAMLLGDATDNVDGDDAVQELDPNDPRIQVEMDKIKADIEPLVMVDNEPGEVRVSWFDDRPMIAELRQLGGPEGIRAFTESFWAKPAGLALLALVSIGIMLLLARKSMQQPPMPTAEELAGIPPTLPSDDDLVGEVEESEPSMAGVEVAEEDIRSRKVAEQISDLVKANPQEAANLFNKWINTED